MTDTDPLTSPTLEPLPTEPTYLAEIVTPTAEPANDIYSMRAAVAFLGIFTLAALGCATWLQAVGSASEVAWTLVGTGVGALAMLATTRLGGTRPQ